MRLTVHTEPAQPGSTNLDAVAVGDAYVVVADGVTPTTEQSGCTHGTHWYTTTLVSALAGALDDAPDRDRPLPVLTREAIAAVADSHRDCCDLTHPDHPAAMLAVLRENADHLEYLVIGDALLLVEVDGAVRSITDGRPDALPLFTPEFVRRRRNMPGGFVVAGPDPDVVDRALYGRVPRLLMARAAVMTDGGARLSDRFGQLDHPQLLDLVEFAGPARLVQRVREAERDETDVELARRRGRRHDDATVVMVHLLDLDAASLVQLQARAATLTTRLPQAMDVEVWCGMVADLARVHHAVADHGRPTDTSYQLRQAAYLLTILARSVHAGVVGPATETPPWPDLPRIPEAIELRCSAAAAALSAARSSRLRGQLLEQFAAQVHADSEDSLVGTVIGQVVWTFMVAARQPAHGRRPLPSDVEPKAEPSTEPTPTTGPQHRVTPSAPVTR